MKKLNNCCALILLLFVTACSRQANISKGNQKTLDKSAIKTYDFAGKGYQMATVKVFKQDGCNVALVLEKGESVEPDLIPIALSKNDMPVWVKYSEQTGKSSICKLGVMVKVIDIQKRKKG